MSEAENDDKLIAAILAGGVKIPPMPSVLLEFARLSHDPDAGPREYAALIGKDAGISGAVFRVVGSPVLGLRTKVETLDKAITVLGLRTTAAIVQGEAMHNALLDPAQATVMDSLWRRLNGIAELCMAAYRALRPRGISQDQVFLLGLFHDCGVVIVCRRYPEYADAFLAAGGGLPDLIALDRACQTSHAVLGQTVARNWQLPEDIGQAIRYHHSPRLPGCSEGVARLIAILRFAMHLYNLRNGDDDGEWALWRDKVLQVLNLEAEELEVVEAELA